MMKKIIKNHRCEGSLNAHVSINYGDPYEFMCNPGQNLGWWLIDHPLDFEYDCVLNTPICKIKYCPFCGEELKGLTF